MHRTPPGHTTRAVRKKASKLSLLEEDRFGAELRDRTITWLLLVRRWMKLGTDGLSAHYRTIHRVAQSSQGSNR